MSERGGAGRSGSSPTWVAGTGDSLREASAHARFNRLEEAEAEHIGRTDCYNVTRSESSSRTAVAS